MNGKVRALQSMSKLPQTIFYLQGLCKGWTLQLLTPTDQTTSAIAVGAAQYDSALHSILVLFEEMAM
jgi:hypothetical protein